MKIKKKRKIFRPDKFTCFIFKNGPFKVTNFQTVLCSLICYASILLAGKEHVYNHDSRVVNFSAVFFCFGRKRAKCSKTWLGLVGPLTPIVVKQIYKFCNFLPNTF